MINNFIANKMDVEDQVQMRMKESLLSNMKDKLKPLSCTSFTTDQEPTNEEFSNLDIEESDG